MKLTSRQYAAIREKKLRDATERELAQVERRALRVVAALDLALHSRIAHALAQPTLAEGAPESKEAR